MRLRSGWLCFVGWSYEAYQVSREASEESPKNLGLDTWDLMLARAFRTR
jgi:hypothetical protein